MKRKEKRKIFIQKIVLVVIFALFFAIFSQTISTVRSLWTLAIITETAKLCSKKPFIRPPPYGDIEASNLEHLIVGYRD